jgi:hypothetical protein
MVRNGNKPNPQLERDTLRFLCSILIQPTTRMELVHLLDVSQFEDDIHRVIFEEIRAAGPISSRTLREVLPGKIVNRGFAEFDLRQFLGESNASEHEVEELYISVLEMIELRHRDESPGLPH